MWLFEVVWRFEDLLRSMYETVKKYLTHLYTGFKVNATVTVMLILLNNCR